MKRVLLLDDDIDLCEIMAEMVMEMGALSCQAVNSIKELKLIQEIPTRFDLIFVDMNLGINDLNGIDAYKWLREIGYIGQVTFFSGHDRSHPMIQLAMSLPNASVLEKPPSDSQLENLLR
ncbi:MAG: response regulator [Bdellovibrionales bacterium]|nr:response regulator [Bdellovibrionales bacterium]